MQSIKNIFDIIQSIDLTNNFDPDKMRAELEDKVNNYRFTRGDILNKIASMYKEQERGDESDNITAEAAAFLLTERGDTFPGYFQPRAVFADENTLPPYDFFSDDILNYLKKRANRTKNSIIASRFADVVWDFSRDIEMARLAIDAYIDTVKIFKKNLWGVEYARDITRAIQLASMINDSKFIEKIKDFSLNCLSELDKEDDYRFCIDIANAISSSKIQLNSNEQENVKEILFRGVDYYKKTHKKEDKKLGPTETPNEHLSRSLNNSLITLVKSRKIKDIDPQKIKFEIAKSHEAQGDEAFKGGNPLAAMFFYLRAEKSYDELGTKKERDAIRVKIRKAGLENEKELKVIPLKFSVDHTKLEDFIAPILKIDIKSTLELISCSSQFIPSVKDATKRVQDLKKEFPLVHIVPRINLDQGYVIDQIFPLDDIEKQSIIEQLMLDVTIGNAFIDYLFARLEKSGKIKTSDFLEHFQKWGYCKEKNLTLLEKGLNHYFAQDYISSLHILIFQFEDLLRNLLEKTGEPISKPGQVFILKSLLSNEALKAAAGVDLIRYYEIVLRERNGFNYRNKIAHGLMDPNEMNRIITLRIIHLLLTLTRFQIKKS